MIDVIDIGDMEIDEFYELQRSEGLYRQSPAAAPRDAARAVQVRKGAGKFIKPQENSWAAHRALVRDASLRLYYQSELYPFFDDIITQRSNYRPLHDEKDSRFAGYGVLRENVAILRNYIMCEFFPDGSVDKEDIKKVRHMAQIAEFLVAGMNHDTFFGRLNPFATRISINKANLPGSGAQYLNNKILARQSYYNWMWPLLRPLYFVTGKTWPDWSLPPLAQSPFSSNALRLPPPEEDREVSTGDPFVAQAGLRDSRTAMQHSSEIDALADDFTHAHDLVSGIETLHEPARRESIDIAKDILRKLKLVMGNALIEAGLAPNGASNVTILEALKGAVRIYEFNLNKLLSLDPHIAANPSVMAANNAIGMLGFIAKTEVLRVAERGGNHPLAASVRGQIAQMPKEWKAVKGKRFAELFDKLESGLNTVLTRMNQVGDRDTGTDYWLGFQNARPLGGQDPALQQQDSARQAQKAMADNAYFQQLNAQKTMQQQAMVAQQKQQQTRDNSAPNAAARMPLKTQTQATAKAQVSMDQLITKDAAHLMRQSFATDPGAVAVQVSKRAAMTDRIRKQQKESMKVAEQVKTNAEHAQQQLHHQQDAMQQQQQLAAQRKQQRLGM